jgi:hypothetical protein
MGRFPEGGAGRFFASCGRNVGLARFLRKATVRVGVELFRGGVEGCAGSGTGKSAYANLQVVDVPSGDDR